MALLAQAETEYQILFEYQGVFRISSAFGKCSQKIRSLDFDEIVSVDLQCFKFKIFKNPGSGVKFPKTISNLPVRSYLMQNSSSV